MTPHATQLARGRVRLTVTSELPRDLGFIPLSPVLDFGELIREAGLPGVFDPNSVEVLDGRTGRALPHARTEDFAYGDKGRIEWVIEDPTHTEYEIRFGTAATRPALQPADLVPLIGSGDLLRYNAGEPRPITLFSMHLADLTGRGRADLVGCWNYFYRPGSPLSGLVCYPRVDPAADFVFGDLTRLHYVEPERPETLLDFEGVYVEVDVADLDGDGRPDLVFGRAGEGKVTFFLNTGRREPNGLPVFVRHSEFAVPAVAGLGGLCLVDLNQDGVLDLVVNGHYIRNTNPQGWPFQPAPPVDLGAGRPLTAFIDLDGDGRLDAVTLAADRASASPRQGQDADPAAACSDHAMAWRPNLGGEPPRFGPELPLPGIEAGPATALREGPRPGLLVQHTSYQQITLYELTGHEHGAPQFRRVGCARSRSAVLSLSDQAWPCLCDWNGDGVNDLLVGGGYGWPRIIINAGSNRQPAYAEPRTLCAEGREIRLRRDEILASRHWHNMGYSYPVFVDWDGDGLPDLMLPNETNRIIWHRNEGTREAPAFGPRQFLEVDGFPDSPERRAESGRRSAADTVYFRDESSPFFWRTGAAFADWNGDGLMDLITLDPSRTATLFVQYRAGKGRLRLRREGPVTLADGRRIDDELFALPVRWTMSFRAVDWDGDGLLDLVCSAACQDAGRMYLLRNVGSASVPRFAAPREFKLFGEPLRFTIHGPHPWAGDLNGDGKPDLLGCVEWSVYPFFCHAALEMQAPPSYRLASPVREASG